jgi:hypothetical protein
MNHPHSVLLQLTVPCFMRWNVCLVTDGIKLDQLKLTASLMDCSFRWHNYLCVIATVQYYSTVWANKS